MDSDDDYLYDATDSGNESPEGEESDGEQVSDNSDEDNEDVTDATAQDDDFGMDIGLGEEPGSSTGPKIEDEFFFEVSSESGDYLSL
jgi:hypothetical protein